MKELTNIIAIAGVVALAGAALFILGNGSEQLVTNAISGLLGFVSGAAVTYMNKGE